jgi:hypothetical protein
MIIASSLNALKLKNEKFIKKIRDLIVLHLEEFDNG